jgi:hypothetical protein
MVLACEWLFIAVIEYAFQSYRLTTPQLEHPQRISLPYLYD